LTLSYYIIIVGLMLSGVTIIMALWGCSVRMCMSNCWHKLWSLFLYALTISFMIIGAILIQSRSKGFNYINQKCDQVANQDYKGFYKIELDVFLWIQKYEYENYADMIMCSDFCGCNKGSIAE